MSSAVRHNYPEACTIAHFMTCRLKTSLTTPCTSLQPTRIAVQVGQGHDISGYIGVAEEDSRVAVQTVIKVFVLEVRIICCTAAIQ
jgi:hypothetical protein